MWRRFLLVIGLAFAATAAGAASAQVNELPWEVCRGVARAAAPPALTNCQPLRGVIDPQQREIWLRARVPPRPGAPARPLAVYIFGTASSQVWLNGVDLGANGRPGPTAATERPGAYEAAFPIPPSLWRPQGQELILRMSAFHVGMRFDTPVTVGIGRHPQPARLPQLAVTFTATGALLAAFFGFLAVHAMRARARRWCWPRWRRAALQTVSRPTPAREPSLPVHVRRWERDLGLSGVFALPLVASRRALHAPPPRHAARRHRRRCRSDVPAEGFDWKSGVALFVGVVIAGSPPGRLARGGGRPAMLVYLAAFLIVASSPHLLLDVSPSCSRGRRRRCWSRGPAARPGRPTVRPP